MSLTSQNIKINFLEKIQKCDLRPLSRFGQYSSWNNMISYFQDTQLLYGYSSLDLIDNRQILLSTIKYLKDTKRFSTSVT